MSDNFSEHNNPNINPEDGYPTSKELFDDFCDFGAEGKFELIDSQLIVGNSIVGSRLLLRQILQGWGASAAVALAPLEKWVEALAAAYGLSNYQPTSNIIERLDYLESVIQHELYEPENLIAGYRGDDENRHNDVRSQLSTALWQVAELVGGRGFGRDFVMRLGNNGFTPDVMFCTNNSNRNQLYSWYLFGAAELVIEIVRPGHEYADRIKKRDFYAEKGVLEYWIIDAKTQQTEFFNLNEGIYQARGLDADNCYRSSSIPGLVFHPEQLWYEDNWYRSSLEQKIFTLEVPKQPYQRISGIKDGLGWGRLAFAPDLQLTPTPISFEEYICWAPQAKFEFWHGKPQIGGEIGIRNLIGMLLMTFGLRSSIKVLPPLAWISAIKQRFLLEQQDSERKAQWWKLAHQAANILCSDFNIERIAVIRDLTSSKPLNYWSNITLFVWDIPNHQGYKIYQALSNLSKQPEIRVMDEGDYLTVDDENAIARGFVDI